jgi:hypothetical protein
VTESPDHPVDVDLVWPDTATLTHVATCGPCRARLDALAASQDAVRRSLAPLAGPVPIPAEVALRVEQALAREATDARPEAMAGTSASASSGGVDELAARRAASPGSTSRSPASRWLVAAAAAAVVVAAGLVLPRLGGPDDLSAQRSSAQTTPGTAGGAGAGAGSQAAPGGGPPAVLVPGIPPLPPDLLAEAVALTPPGTAATGCGAELAAAVPGTVTAAADPASAAEGVLVLLTVATEAAGQAWWLPSCTATPDTALGASPLP